VEGETRGPKPRPEMKSNGSCVVCMIATLTGAVVGTTKYSKLPHY
jgi:hypothetical protein